MTINTAKPIDFNAPGALDALFAFHRSTFGDTRMEDPAPVETITVPVPRPPVADLDINNPQVQAFMEKARADEKAKLYGTIEGLKSRVEEFGTLQQTVTSLQTEQEARIAEARAAAAKEAEEAARQKWEESDAKTLIAEKDKEWGERFATLQTEREQERQLLLKENQFSQLQNYAQKAVSDAIAGGVIAPELASLVTGNNEAEITASLETVRQASEAIATNIATTLQAAPQVAPPALRGVSPTGYAPVGPMDMTEQTRTLTADQIRDMPMNEWAQLRRNIPGVNRDQSNRGLFS